MKKKNELKKLKFNEVTNEVLAQAGVSKKDVGITEELGALTVNLVNLSKKIEDEEYAKTAIGASVSTLIQALPGGIEVKVGLLELIKNNLLNRHSNPLVALSSMLSGLKSLKELVKDKTKK